MMEILKFLPLAKQKSLRGQQANFDPRDAGFTIRLRDRWSKAWRFVAAYVLVGSVFALF